MESPKYKVRIFTRVVENKDDKGEYSPENILSIKTNFDVESPVGSFDISLNFENNGFDAHSVLYKVTPMDFVEIYLRREPGEIGIYDLPMKSINYKDGFTGESPKRITDFIEGEPLNWEQKKLNPDLVLCGFVDSVEETFMITETSTLNVISIKGRSVGKYLVEYTLTQELFGLSTLKVLEDNYAFVKFLGTSMIECPAKSPQENIKYVFDKVMINGVGDEPVKKRKTAEPFTTTLNEYNPVTGIKDREVETTYYYKNWQAPWTKIYVAASSILSQDVNVSVDNYYKTVEDSPYYVNNIMKYPGVFGPDNWYRYTAVSPLNNDWLTRISTDTIGDYRSVLAGSFRINYSSIWDTFDTVTNKPLNELFIDEKGFVVLRNTIRAWNADDVRSDLYLFSDLGTDAAIVNTRVSSNEVINYKLTRSDNDLKTLVTVLPGQYSAGGITSTAQGVVESAPFDVAAVQASIEANAIPSKKEKALELFNQVVDIVKSTQSDLFGTPLIKIDDILSFWRRFGLRPIAIQDLFTVDFASSANTAALFFQKYGSSWTNGYITVKGDPKYRIGDKLYLDFVPGDAYLKSVSHDYVWGEHYITTLGVERVKQSSSKLPKYFISTYQENPNNITKKETQEGGLTDSDKFSKDKTYRLSIGVTKKGTSVEEAIPYQVSLASPIKYVLKEGTYNLRIFSESFAALKGFKIGFNAGNAAVGPFIFVVSGNKRPEKGLEYHEKGNKDLKLYENSSFNSNNIRSLSVDVSKNTLLTSSHGFYKLEGYGYESSDLTSYTKFIEVQFLVLSNDNFYNYMQVLNRDTGYDIVNHSEYEIRQEMNRWLNNPAYNKKYFNNTTNKSVVTNPADKAELMYMVSDLANTYGVPKNYAFAVANQESSWNPDAGKRSPPFPDAPDRGLFQLSEYFWKDLGNLVWDPETNARVGLSHYLAMYNKTGGTSWRIAYMAYNEGYKGDTEECYSAEAIRNANMVEYYAINDYGGYASV